MKRISAIFSTILLAGLFVSCSDISSLENRLESAESRIDALEKNLETMNSNVEAIKKLVEGGTVSSVSEKDGVYTITFGDGKVVTLNQGSTFAPVVSVDSEGYWTVDYGDGAENILVSGNKIKAAGSDGVTPKFSVDASGYWTVSYDNGQNYSQVRDADGNPVKAVAESGSASGDSWFRKVSVNGDNLEVVLQDGSTYSLPIVKDFSCVIKGADDLVIFAYGETKTFTVESVGIEYVKVTAPQNWSASLNGSVLSITAPATETKSLSADSATDVCLLAISKSGLSLISKVRVQASSSAVVTYPGLYGKYRNGEDVTVGGVTVNKTAYPSVNYISASSADKTLKAGVNFVDADVVAEFPTGEIALPFIVAGNTEGSRTKITASSQVKFASTAKVADNIVEFQNVTISTEGISEGYLLSNINDNVMQRIGFNDCRIDIVGDKNLSYMLSTRNVNSFVVKDCDVKANSSKVVYMFQVQANACTVAELTFDNNVFWSESAVVGFYLYHNRQSAVSTVTVTHNTFVNVYPPASYAYCQMNDLVAGSISNNLFYFTDYTTNCNTTFTGIVKEETKTNVDETLYATFVSNYAIYAEGSVPNKRMKVGQNTNSGTIYNKIPANASEIFDFGDDSANFNIAKGIFKSKSTVYGAQR